MGMVNEEPKNAGNGSKALAGLLNQLNVPTLIAVMLMGGGNLFQGIQSSATNHEELERAIREVHQLYEKLDDTDSRQLQALKNQEEILSILRGIRDRRGSN
jgi:ABC-type phosphate transport system auxiliary subunit